MPLKYAIRITLANLALIRVLHPIVEVELKEDTNRYFLFTVHLPNSTIEHDVVAEDDLYNYDGHQKGQRIIIL
jgi:hypothetical protein